MRGKSFEYQNFLFTKAVPHRVLVLYFYDLNPQETWITMIYTIGSTSSFSIPFYRKAGALSGQHMAIYDKWEWDIWCDSLVVTTDGRDPGYGHVSRLG